MENIKQIQDTSYFISSGGKVFNKHGKEISPYIDGHLRKATGLDITYYSCRHSFASVYMNEEGSNPLHLAAMMGRSPAGIFRYVQTIQSDEDIIHERSRMGL